MYKLAFPVLADFLIGFQRDPEAELEITGFQRQLFSALYRNFSEVNFKIRLSRQALDIAYYPEQDSVELTPVKTAYPAKEKFDIAVLGPAISAPLKKEDHEAKRFQHFWEQPVAIGIYLHLCKAEQDSGKYLGKLVRDLKKLTNYGEVQGGNFSGLTLLLVQGDVEADARLVPGELSNLEGVFALVMGDNGVFSLR
ncbi:MAG TPA: hypothetical protein ENJ82_07130 [Bacteroidetes bacterium]|nr:hypothetical protein [Bacteroidota bacterium]